MSLQLSFRLTRYFLLFFSQQRKKVFHSILCLILVFGCGISSCTVQEQSTTEETAIEKQYVDLVYPFLDTENSRWFFFSSACRPFGMVNLSPDTKMDGAWGSGYRYELDTIRGFSHVHAWQLSGVSILPVSGTAPDLFNHFQSHFSHENEIAHPGYHAVTLDRYGIRAELTSTQRVGFHHYQYSGDQKQLMINLGGEQGPSQMVDGQIRQIDDRTIVGAVTNAPTFRRPNPTPVFFCLQADQNMKLSDQQADQYLIAFTESSKDIKLKVGISYTSIENAQNNLDTELSHWDFDQVVADSRNEWNELLGRIDVSGDSETAQRRFYTDLWHALQGRRTINDVNGQYPDHTSSDLRVGQIPLNSEGKPAFDHFNSDSFWGAQWTINTLWHLVYPEYSEMFVKSLLQYYKDGGMVPRGPSGGNYTYVMTGASSTPFIVSAYQKGLIDFDAELAYEALKKNHMEGGIMAKAGYEHATSIGGGLNHYLQLGYVPWPLPEGEFGSHQDGVSLTLEYAYQDWTLAQFAKALGKDEDYAYFMKRSQNYSNVFDAQSGWMRPRNEAGQWYKDFDPYQYEHGFNESNGAQSTWFVPQDLEGLAELMGGKDAAIEKLNAQFEKAEQLGFTSGTAHAKERHPEYSRIPINYGNQPSIQTAFIFNELGRPDLTQYWANKVVNNVYDGIQTSRGYNGDEDQGLMGSLAVLMKIGLFQMNGGTEADPSYQLFTPSFDNVSIRLNPDFYTGERFEIVVQRANPEQLYVDQVLLNGTEQEQLSLKHSDITAGGLLSYQLK